MHVDLRDKVAIVTGGSKGIGRAISLAYAGSGTRVVVASRTPEAGSKVVKEIMDKGGEAVFEPTNILIYEEVERMVGRTIDRFGRVDIIVGSGEPADSPESKLFPQTPPSELTAHFLTRCIARLNCARAVVNHMVSCSFGKIILITTDAGRMPTPSQTMVGAAAAAVIFWTRSAARELARYGIRVNCICTTITQDTPGWERYLQAKEIGPDETIVRVFNEIRKRTPFGLNTPQDLANIALFLASDESNQISGATISVNGGISFPG